MDAVVFNALLELESFMYGTGIKPYELWAEESAVMLKVNDKTYKVHYKAVDNFKDELSALCAHVAGDHYNCGGLK